MSIELLFWNREAAIIIFEVALRIFADYPKLGCEPLQLLSKKI